MARYLRACLLPLAVLVVALFLVWLAWWRLTSEPDIDMKLVLIPKGTFLMGSPEGEKDRSTDEEQHEAGDQHRAAPEAVGQRPVDELPAGDPGEVKGQHQLDPFRVVERADQERQYRYNDVQRAKGERGHRREQRERRRLSNVIAREAKQSRAAGSQSLSQKWTEENQ